MPGLGLAVGVVLDSPDTVPGQVITGHVRLRGGPADVKIGELALSLVASVEAEYGDHELLRLGVRQGIRVPSGQSVLVPFRLPVPWETPITAFRGTHLSEMSVGLRPELVVSETPRSGALKLLRVGATPWQAGVLDALGQAGFRYRRTGVGRGHLPGVPHGPRLHQELGFLPPVRYAGRIGEVELRFAVAAEELFVVLEADHRGDGYLSGQASPGHFQVTPQNALMVDWRSLVDQWLLQIAGRAVSSGLFSIQ